MSNKKNIIETNEWSLSPLCLFLFMICGVYLVKSSLGEILEGEISGGY